MRKLFWSFFAFLVSMTSSYAMSQPTTEIEINGETAKVYFNDGDTFRILTGHLKGRRSRLEGFNALESYGPVQRWGSFKATELLKIAEKATENARKGGWHCTTDLSSDRYGRILSVCMDLAIDQVSKGLAHVMTVSSEPGDPTLISKQHEAILEARGMWAKGAPKYVITSLHSLDEEENQTKTYDRFVSTEDGHSVVEVHNRNYADCQEVCYSPDEHSQAVAHSQDACMTYISFDHRYGLTTASCLK